MKRCRPQDWYRIRKLSENITWIDEPHIKEFYRCNIWHIRGRDKDMMVDSGMGVVSLRQWVPLVSERPLDAVASHTHFDHVGCHHEFPCRLCHEAEAEILTNPTQINTLAADYVTDEIFDVLPPPPYQSATYGVEAAPVTRILEDGDIVDLGDRHFEVIHTPGHSPGGIALWDPTAQLLIAGDIVYDGPLVETGGLTEQTQYIASMKRLLNLPAQTVLGGHFAPYSTRRHQKIITDWLRSKDV